MSISAIYLPIIMYEIVCDENSLMHIIHTRNYISMVIPSNTYNTVLLEHMHWEIII